MILMPPKSPTSLKLSAPTPAEMDEMCADAILRALEEVLARRTAARARIVASVRAMAGLPRIAAPPIAPG
jgi:hypothetical protein